MKKVHYSRGSSRSTPRRVITDYNTFSSLNPNTNPPSAASGSLLTALIPVANQVNQQPHGLMNTHPLIQGSSLNLNRQDRINQLLTNLNRINSIPQQPASVGSPFGGISALNGMAGLNGAQYSVHSNSSNTNSNTNSTTNSNMNRNEVDPSSSDSASSLSEDDSASSSSDDMDNIAVHKPVITEKVDISGWNALDIYDWIMSIDAERFGKYDKLKQMLEDEQLTGEDLSGITEQNLKEFGITKFADKKMLYNKIQNILPQKEERRNEKGSKGMVQDMDDEDVPDQFLDPITYELMVDPVLCRKSGQTYERKTIEGCIEQSGLDPITQQKIKKKHLFPNRVLKELIDEWRKEHATKE